MTRNWHNLDFLFLNTGSIPRRTSLRQPEITGHIGQAPRDIKANNDRTPGLPPTISDMQTNVASPFKRIDSPRRGRLRRTTVRTDWPSAAEPGRVSPSSLGGRASGVGCVRSAPVRERTVAVRKVKFLACARSIEDPRARCPGVTRVCGTVRSKVRRESRPRALPICVSFSARHVPAVSSEPAKT